MLTPPEYPDELEYLRRWSSELYGRSGIGMNGYAPLSYATIGEWSRFTGITPTGEEVGALFILDAARLNPGKAEVKRG